MTSNIVSNIVSNTAHSAETVEEFLNRIWGSAVDELLLPDQAALITLAFIGGESLIEKFGPNAVMQ